MRSKGENKVARVISWRGETVEYQGDFYRLNCNVPSLGPTEERVLVVLSPVRPTKDDCCYMLGLRRDFDKDYKINPEGVITRREGW